MLKSLLLVITVFANLGSASLSKSEEWNAWRAEYNKKYDSPLEEESRYLIWSKNYDEIEAHNSDKTQTYQKGLNQFSDLSLFEFRQMTGLDYDVGRQPTYVCDYINNPFLESNNVDLPVSVDWRTKGVVSPIKNQGNCGSCWSFATAATLESLWRINGGQLYNLSEQQLVDCSFGQGNLGCNGGFPDFAFNYTKQFGLCTYESYPYTAVQGPCRQFSCLSVVKSRGCANLWTGDKATTENVMNFMITKQPLVVLVSAGNSIWGQYKSGVVNDLSCNAGQIDHAVVAVGYNKPANGTAYWIVRNSWGTTWGVSGYIYLAMGNDMCRIAENPSVPLGP